MKDRFDWIVPGGARGDRALAVALATVEQVALYRQRSDAALRTALGELLTALAAQPAAVAWRAAVCVTLAAAARPLRGAEVLAAVRAVRPEGGRAVQGVRSALATLVRRGEVDLTDAGYQLVGGPGRAGA